MSETATHSKARWPEVKLKHISRILHGELVPKSEIHQGKIPVFGSNGPYAKLKYANTSAPVIIIGRKGACGKINWSDRPVFASDTTFFIGKSETSSNLRWLFWLLQTLDLDATSNATAIPTLNRESAYNKFATLPPLPIQQAIADYLDAETARIDALIVVKETLINLLAEKRRTLVTQTVTRGLNTNVAMRDSGIPWLGKVPVHWRIVRLRFIARIQSGLALGKKHRHGRQIEFPYLGVSNVQDGYIDLSDVKKIEVDDQKALECLLQTGDVLMTGGGDANKLGRGSIWRGEIAPCLHQNHVFAVRPLGVSPEWLSLWTSTDSAKAFFESRSKQSTRLASISSSNLKELPLALPPELEQKSIILWVQSQIEELAAIETAAQTTIILLRERREAIIAAVVTGQISVETSSCK